MSTPKPEQNAF